MTTITKLAERIHSDRRRSGLTQGQVADAMTTDAQTVSRQLVGRWEAGTSIPDALQLARLARLFKSSLAALYEAVEIDLTQLDEGSDLHSVGTRWSGTWVEQPTLFDEPFDPTHWEYVVDLTAEEVTRYLRPSSSEPAAA